MTCQTPTLTHERLQQILNYDPETGVFTWRISPRYRIPHGSRAGFIGGKGYRSICINNRTYRCNRLAWFYMTGVWPVQQIDHKNGDKTDDSWGNLRPATNAQNQWNVPPRKDNSSGMTGVYWFKPKQRWTAMLFINGKRKFLGSFKTKDEAIEARRQAAIAEHGEFVHPTQAGGR